jgi:GMP synthase-like glutamine amidotransferase
MSSSLYTNSNRTRTEHNSFEDIPWINRLVEFTQQVLAQDRVRLLGICFGHQIVGRALGAKVGRSDQGWEIAVCDMDLTDKGKELFGRDKIVSSVPVCPEVVAGFRNMQCNATQNADRV